MKAFPRSFLIVLLLIAAGLAAGGAWYYRAERGRVRAAAEAQLQAVATLKVRELTRWRADQLGVATQLVQDQTFRRCVRNWLADRSAGTVQELRDCTRAAQENFGYNGLSLVDPAGAPLVTLGGQPGRLDAEDLQARARALQSRRPVLANLHFNLDNEAPQMAVVAPVYADDDRQAAPLGAVILEQNLSRVLYPLIQSWPIPSKSAETLLVERTGDSVLFLNELRHRAGTALKLRLPLSEIRVPAVFAANGGTGVFYGPDYRGVPVVSVVEPIPDSPWIMLAKVDEAEVFADWHAQFILMTDLLVTVMGLAAALVFFVWQRNQKSHFRALYHAEVNRRADEERHRTTLTSIGDAVVSTDAQGRVEMLNPAAEKLTDWTLAEVRGRPFAEVIRIRNEETGQPVEDLVARVLREGAIIGLANHALLVTREGREVPVSDSAAPILSGEGNTVHGVVVVLTDQTRQRATQRALRESEQRFRNIFDESPVGYQSLGPDGRILDVNPAWLRLVDRPRAEVVGRRLDEFMTPASAAEFPGRFARFLERGEVHDREFDLRTRAGAVVNLIFDGVFVRDAEGRPHHSHCVMHNLTAFKRAEAAARRDREHLALIVSSVQGIVWELEPATFLFTYVSPQAEVMLGYPVADWAQPGFWADHLHPDDRERSLSFCAAQTGAGRDHEFEYRMRAADGRWVWLHDIVTVVREDGRPTRLRGIMTDITARKEAEAALGLLTRRTHSLLELSAADGQMNETALLQRGLELAEELTGSRVAFNQFITGDEKSVGLVACSRCTRENYCQTHDTARCPMNQTEVWAEVLRTKRPVILNDYADPPGPHPQPAGHPPLFRLVSVPVIEDGRVVMIAGVGNKDTRYTDAEVETVRLIANEIRRVAQRRRAEKAQEENSRTYQSILATSLDGFISMDTNTELVLDVNGTYCRLSGYPREELVGHRVTVVEAGMNAAEVTARIRQIEAEGSVRFESVHQRKDGTLWPVEINVTSLGPGSGRICAFLRDLTARDAARRGAEAAARELAAREAQLQLITNHAPVCLAQIDADQRYRFVNQPYADLQGRPAAALIGRSLREVMGEPHYVQMQAQVDQVLAGTPVAFDFERRGLPDGPQFIHAHYVPERDGSGRVAGFLAVIADITARKQMEEALRASELRWQFALEGASEGVWDWELTTGRLYCSPGLVALLGHEPGDFTGRIEDLRSRLHPDDNESFQVEKKRYFSGAAPSFRHEHRLRHKDGNYRWILARGKIVERGPGGEPVRMIGTHTDITERRRAVEQLLLLDTALQAVPAGITITDREGNIEWANAGFYQMTGYRPDEVLGANHRILKPGHHSREFYAAIWEKVLRGEIWSGELVNRRKDGTEYPERVTIAPVIHGGTGITHFIAIKQDITAQKQLERQLLRSQRMEGIGQLAGGIAHDLNNVLTPVLLCVEMLRLNLLTDEAKHLLEIIENSARRGAGVVRQVLTFARGVEGEHKLLRPQDLVRELAGIIGETFPRDITVRLVVAEDTPLVRGDTTQLHQVLLNLAVNARDEMPAGGALTIGAGRVTVAQRRQTALGEMPPGDYAVLKVGDTGPGIPPENHDRIFEPFFTTKPQGKGTGLGLPTAHGIIRGHGGFIELESAVGAGAEFRVYLPAAAEAESGLVQPAAAPTLAGGGRTLLVCDDEPLICDVAEAVLTRHGFAVLKATSGREALDLLARREGTVAAALLDIMMPQMGGDRAAEELWRTRPALPVLFMSGLMDGNLLTDRSKLPPSARAGFLRKPFTEAQLLHAMARLLPGASQG